MNAPVHPIDKAASAVGGRAELARILNVSPAAIGNWKFRGVPIEHCPAIERATARAVCRQDLRPTDWQGIWPELAHPAPTNPPAAQAAQQGVANAGSLTSSQSS